MLTFYKHKVDKGEMRLTNVPNPYRDQMIKLGYTETIETAEGE